MNVYGRTLNLATIDQEFNSKTESSYIDENVRGQFSTTFQGNIFTLWDMEYMHIMFKKVNCLGPKPAFIVGHARLHMYLVYVHEQLCNW